MKKDRAKNPTDQLTAYERWELPVMAEGLQNSQPATVKLPTAGELEKIQQQAYQEGFRQGQRAGRRAGFDEGRQKGYQQGRQQGMEQGIEAGTEQGKAAALASKTQELSEHLQRLNELIIALRLPLQAVDEQTEETLVNLVLAVSRAVIFRELQINSSQIVRVVNEALAALPSRKEQATVYLHPDDANLLQRYIGGNSEGVSADIVVNMTADHMMSVVADAGVMAGGCRVETQHTLLDFTIEKRFQQIVQQMLARQNTSSVNREASDLSNNMGEISELHRDVLEAAGTLADELADATVVEDDSTTHDDTSQSLSAGKREPAEHPTTAVIGPDQSGSAADPADPASPPVEAESQVLTRSPEESINDQS